jgi:hypothetical protein
VVCTFRTTPTNPQRPAARPVFVVPPRTRPDACSMTGTGCGRGCCRIGSRKYRGPPPDSTTGAGGGGGVGGTSGWPATVPVLADEPPALPARSGDPVALPLVAAPLVIKPNSPGLPTKAPWECVEPASVPVALITPDVMPVDVVAPDTWPVADRVPVRCRCLSCCQSLTRLRRVGRSGCRCLSCCHLPSL